MSSSFQGLPFSRSYSEPSPYLASRYDSYASSSTRAACRASSVRSAASLTAPLSRAALILLRASTVLIDGHGVGFLWAAWLWLPFADAFARCASFHGGSRP